MSATPLTLIMLVDDNDTDNFLHKRIIETANFAKTVIIKNSGKSALEYLHTHKGTIKDLPDVIFLDLNMPIVDGFIFLFEFENFPPEVKNKCKIVILSSSENKNDINRVIDNENVIQYFTKPLSEESLHNLKVILTIEAKIIDNLVKNLPPEF